MTELIYEQPLNEKIRSYLRLEYLAQQLQANLDHDHQHRCFYPLFSLCELSERCDYRGEVLKDLDRQLFALSKWQSLPSINDEQIELYISKLSAARDVLQVAQRTGHQLKQDRFLTALRQRFNMPGASCNFDLPQLHYWLAKPWEDRQAEYQDWVSHFASLLSPVKLLLDLTRQTTEYQIKQASGGFYQGNSEQALSLIRVKLSADLGCYPTISGHRNRYAIHFVQFDQQKHSDQTVEFELATCP
ncbi:cell division protein ZapD [Shewanella sp. MBTL60-007]|uniref:cell division protein ZapD n=1 Tax=Shewanella sp. MBTL60-007 TaxID=2815911 RepID=UPI001C7EFBF2|nr:cell division protein ZapD [Shewanella sp. MBTL60-007]